MSVVEIRACSAEDIDHLRQSWPTPGDVATSHYTEQQNGHATFLVAWSDCEPLGSAVIEWGGCIGRNARVAYPNAAEVIHLHVRPEHRNRGTGTALIEAAENKIRDRGTEIAAISVGVDNLDAARLYDRRGYQRTGVTDVSEYEWLDEVGTAHREREVNELLIKRL